MPDRSAVRLHADAEQAFDDLEQAADHVRLGEILLHLLLREGVAGLEQLFRDEGGIPGLEVGDAEFVAGKGEQLGHVAFGEGLGLLRHVAQEIEDLGRGVGHLGQQRFLGIVVEAEHGGIFCLEGEQALHDRAVVPFRLGIAVIDLGSARCVGAVHALAQVAVFGILHEWTVGRCMQGELPAVQTGFLSDLAGGFLGVVRQAGEFRLVGDDFGEGVGRIEQVFRELGRQLGEFFGNGQEAWLLVFRQFGAAQAEVAQLVLDDLLAGRAQAGVIRALLECTVFVEELQILPELRVEAGDVGQHLVVGIAPGRDVIDRMQMAHHAPGAAQAFEAIGEGAGEIFPGDGRRIGDQALDQGAALGQQLGDGGFDVGRFDQVEAGQVGEVEQRVLCEGHGVGAIKTGGPGRPCWDV